MQTRRVPVHVDELLQLPLVELKYWPLAIRSMKIVEEECSWYSLLELAAADPFVQRAAMMIVPPGLTTAAAAAMPLTDW